MLDKSMYVNFLQPKFCAFALFEQFKAQECQSIENADLYFQLLSGLDESFLLSDNDREEINKVIDNLREYMLDKATEIYEKESDPLVPVEKTLQDFKRSQLFRAAKLENGVSVLMCPIPGQSVEAAQNKWQSSIKGLLHSTIWKQLKANQARGGMSAYEMCLEMGPYRI